MTQKGRSSSELKSRKTSCCKVYKLSKCLQDEEIRNGLKSYSQWPTFPQLYADGEFIGGCDIVLELLKEGRLKEQLQGQKG